MNKKIKFILLFLLFAQIASADFQKVSPDLFTNPIVKFFNKVSECKWHISCYSNKNLGSFTQISSTDSQVNFPTTYNANLNKTIEVGTTTVASITTLPNLTSAATLATVGTITSGTWNASVLTVTYGGTGAATLGSNQVLLGNGTGVITTVSGYGTSGQFLTSQGSPNVPTWTSAPVDLTLNYNWTGPHLFTASTTFTASSTFKDQLNIASSTTINSNKYVWPSSPLPTASSTLTFTSATGTLLWAPIDGGLIAETVLSGNNTTLQVDFTGRRDLHVVIDLIPNGTDNEYIRFNGDAGSNYLGTSTATAFFPFTASARAYTHESMIIDITNNTSQNKYVVFSAIGDFSGNRDTMDPSAWEWSNTSAQITRITITRAGGGTFASGSFIRVYASGK